MKARIVWSRYRYWFALSPCSDGHVFAFAQRLNQLNLSPSKLWH
jgi:hypothetical protein